MFKILATASVVAAKRRYQWAYDYRVCATESDKVAQSCLDLDSYSFTIDDRCKDKVKQSQPSKSCSDALKDKCDGQQTSVDPMLALYDLGEFAEDPLPNMAYRHIHCKEGYVNAAHAGSFDSKPMPVRCVSGSLRLEKRFLKGKKAEFVCRKKIWGPWSKCLYGQRTRICENCPGIQKSEVGKCEGHAYKLTHDYNCRDNQTMTYLCMNATTFSYVDNHLCDQASRKQMIAKKCANQYQRTKSQCDGKKFKHNKLKSYDLAHFSHRILANRMYMALRCPKGFQSAVDEPISVRCNNTKLEFVATKTQKLKDIQCKAVQPTEKLTLDTEKVVEVDQPKELAPLEEVGNVCRRDLNKLKKHGKADLIVEAKDRKTALQENMHLLPQDTEIYIRSSRSVYLTKDKHYVYWNTTDAEKIESMAQEEECWFNGSTFYSTMLE